MAHHCEQCGFEVTGTAKFCKSCGAKLPPAAPAPAKEAPPVAQPAASSVSAAAEARYCERCRTKLPPGAKFCKRCGTPVPGAGAPARVLPPRKLGRRERRTAAPASSFLSGTGGVAILGAAVALVGCFLPLIGGIGENVSVISLVSEDVPYAFAVPLSAAGIAFLVLVAGRSRALGKGLTGGAIIAFASPWTIVWVTSLSAAHRVLPFAGDYGYGASIGVGAMLLTAGFGTSLVGGFLVVRDAVREAASESEKSA